MSKYELKEGKMVKIDEAKSTKAEAKIEGRSVKTDSFNWTIFLGESRWIETTAINFSTGEINFEVDKEFKELWEKARKKYAEAEDSGDKKLQKEISDIIYDAIWSKKLNEEFVKSYFKFRAELENSYKKFEKESKDKLKKIIK